MILTARPGTDRFYGLHVQEFISAGLMWCWACLSDLWQVNLGVFTTWRLC